MHIQSGRNVKVFLNSVLIMWSLGFNFHLKSSTVQLFDSEVQFANARLILAHYVKYRNFT